MFGLRCGDVGFECDKEFEDYTEEGILSKVKEHGKSDHNMLENDFTPSIMDKIKGNIQKKK